MRREKLIAAVAVAAAVLAGIYLAYALWFASNANSRESLLRALPPDATAVIYVDVAELRQGAVLKNLAGLGAGATVDPEYKQFVSETGFDYEKDLDRVGIAMQNAGAGNHYFALADGKFDRKRIEVYLRKNGSSETKNGREIFHLPANLQGRAVSAVFLSAERIAFTDALDLNAEIESGRREAGHTEWTERFVRLSGSPMFALVRQEAAIGAILDAQAPGGIRSPQLVQLLNQLLWISIAGKPLGTGFQAVVEGECPNEATMRQLADFLNGIRLMAQSGLNDPRLRQKMDPAERDAYLQLLGSVDVTKLDRGTGKSVRLALLITPEVWEKVAASQTVLPKEVTSSPSVPAKAPARNNKPTPQHAAAN
jgi:hypothetical protein